MKSANTEFLKSLASCSIALTILTSFAILPALAAEPLGIPKSQRSQFSQFYSEVTTVTGTKPSAQELDQQADRADKAGHYGEASAGHLAAAASIYAGRNFERARPYFDKAFLAAEKMSLADQKEMLAQLSKIISAVHDIDDFEVYKYFAQNRLRLLRKQPNSNSTVIYHEVQTLAFSCSRNHRYKEALSLLNATLADLRSAEPQSQSIGACLNTLARVSEDSGDLASACKFYDQETAFTKALPQSQNYHRALQHYTMFLVGHKMYKELVPVASAFYDEIIRTGDKDRISLQTIAQALAEANEGLSGKFFQLAYDNDKVESKSAMNTAYGTICCEWAKMLHKYGKTNEAIAVLKNGMAFCRTVRWPDAVERNMPAMVSLCEQYMNASNQMAQAAALRRDFDSELKFRREHAAATLLNELDSDIANSNRNALAGVRALTAKANLDFDRHDCKSATNLIERAVSLYETNAKSTDSAQMYNCFYNLSQRFRDCNQSEYIKTIAMRLVKARMVNGFSDPSTGMQISNCGGTTWAFDDLCGWSRDDKTMAEILALARASHNRLNIIYVLNAMLSNQLGEKRAEILEELESLRASDTDKNVLIGSMFQTADTYAYLKHWDKALAKCKAALVIGENLVIPKNGWRRHYSGGFYSIGSQFESGQQLVGASELYSMGYAASIKEGSDLNVSMNVRFIDSLLKKYKELHDTASGAALLNNLLQITTGASGPDNTFARDWLIRLTTLYLQDCDLIKGKQSYEQLASSIFKPGMTISKENQDSLRPLADLLNGRGMTREAGKIKDKLKSLEQQHCLAP
ncbi:MAG: hypothetical protein WCT03_06020 [Candidatus Obscuribacterales bacterium]|jgi:hypothetical protein